ncbi:exodeoxyribonuclease V subunit alpha [Neptuniibacter caesariensis]|uniref:RecBCD enzyme subunit RecD n=1 Tax=Neptuniibacter caesariensis TaxID=207954 RepID=A0A7U8C6F2_NEPCE|nr:exodeoxyribonuclease V subunit alpha [Neptuniibacter caesariensis]EAR60950.1 exodeoxyribonuclease V alpha chain [Oceanospirillum sp. MED92] [Neptuniibacter caesariensis]
MPEINKALIDLKGWAENGLIRNVDFQFAKLVAEQKPSQPQLIYLAALVSFELASGNVCLPKLRLLSAKGYWDEEIESVINQQDWSSLKAEAFILGQPELDSNTLLLFDQERFYLKRYWEYESAIASQLINRAQTVDVDRALLKEGLAELFPMANQEIDWQKVAAAVAVQKRFSVISGGPGTGKTTTVIKLLALYIAQAKAHSRNINIKLVAPTGKAAARLGESISSAKQRLSLDADIAELIPEQAGTLHRLLGVIPNSIRFKHSQENPLHLDLLVLDEASMVDLPMMCRLLAALPAEARLILLGDRDQLASVEAGSVLGDICSWPGQLDYGPKQADQLFDLCQLPEVLPISEGTPFADCLALLRKSYRFDESSGIGQLARAVNLGNKQAVSCVLKAGYSDLQQHNLSADSYELMISETVNFHAKLLRDIAQGLTPEQSLDYLSNYQLLCALREGPYGVVGLNDRIRQGLQSRGLIKEEGLWYPGRPIMITRNDQNLGLFNGDIGIAYREPDGRIKVFFEQQGEVRSVLPSRLPEHQTVYAMTVHKSQGSEFTRVALLLPPVDSPLMTRELLYTGITRARESLALFTTKGILTAATERKTERAGGLALRLWKEAN